MYKADCISGVMASVLASCAVDHSSTPGQVKLDYEIGICCFSAKHAALKIRSDWLTQNQDNVFEWRAMSTADCCFSELALKKSK